MTDTSMETTTSATDVEAVPVNDDARLVETIRSRATDPDFERVVGDVITRTLATVEDPMESMRGVNDAFTRYLRDRDAASLLVMLIVYWDDEPYVVPFLETVDDETRREQLAACLSRLSARYGRELRVRNDLTARDPDDWQFFDTFKFYEPDRLIWRIEVALQHFDQHRSRIAGPPLSFLRLVNQLLDVLADLHPVNEGPEPEYDPDAIHAFLDGSQRLTDVLQTMLEPPVQIEAEEPATV